MPLASKRESTVNTVVTARSRPVSDSVTARAVIGSAESQRTSTTARSSSPRATPGSSSDPSRFILLHVELLQVVEYPSVMATTSAAVPGRLTAREGQVLSLIGQGLTNREIGGRLGIAEKTVKNTVTVVLAKLGFQRRAQAAIYITIQRITAAQTADARVD